MNHQNKFKVALDHLEEVLSFLNYCLSQHYGSINALKLYMLLMDLSVKYDQAPAFERVYADLQSRQLDVSANQPFQVVLLKYYGQTKQFQPALALYQNLKKKGVALNQQLLGSLVDTCVKCK